MPSLRAVRKLRGHDQVGFGLQLLCLVLLMPCCSLQRGFKHVRVIAWPGGAISEAPDIAIILNPQTRGHDVVKVLGFKALKPPSTKHDRCSA